MMATGGTTPLPTASAAEPRDVRKYAFETPKPTTTSASGLTRTISMRRPIPPDPLLSQAIFRASPAYLKSPLPYKARQQLQQQQQPSFASFKQPVLPPPQHHKQQQQQHREENVARPPSAALSVTTQPETTPILPRPVARRPTTSASPAASILARSSTSAPLASAPMAVPQTTTMPAARPISPDTTEKQKASIQATPAAARQEVNLYASSQNGGTPRVASNDLGAERTATSPAAALSDTPVVDTTPCAIRPQHQVKTKVATNMTALLKAMTPAAPTSRTAATSISEITPSRPVAAEQIVTKMGIDKEPVDETKVEESVPKTTAEAVNAVPLEEKKTTLPTATTEVKQDLEPAVAAAPVAGPPPPPLASVSDLTSTKIEKPKKTGKIVSLSEWFLRSAGTALNADVPPFVVDGRRCTDEATGTKIQWHTSLIKDILDSRHVCTNSGGVYHLSGPPKKSMMQRYPIWLQDAFEDGYPEDWKDVLNEYMVYMRRGIEPERAKKYATATYDDDVAEDVYADELPQPEDDAQEEIEEENKPADHDPDEGDNEEEEDDDENEEEEKETAGEKEEDSIPGRKTPSTHSISDRQPEGTENRRRSRRGEVFLKWGQMFSAANVVETKKPLPPKKPSIFETPIASRKRKIPSSATGRRRRSSPFSVNGNASVAKKRRKSTSMLQEEAVRLKQQEKAKADLDAFDALQKKWTPDERIAFDRAMLNVTLQGNEQFWEDVAAHVRSKTAEDCESYFQMAGGGMSH